MHLGAGARTDFLAVPRAGLAISTRERPEMRRRLLQAGITQMSAGSVTVPGGYRIPAWHAPRSGPGRFRLTD